jgi:hypothetical protein
MNDRHLAATDLAAYVDRTLSASERAEAEQHLAWCDACRSELREVGSALRTYSRTPRRRVWIGPAAAAAAIILLVAYPLSQRPTEEEPVHSDIPTEIEQRPELADPASVVDPAGAHLLHWSRVDRADRYRVSIFDTSGSVVWRAETSDTSVALPASALGGSPGPYLWRVDARVGIDRWVESRLAPLDLSGAKASGTLEGNSAP